MQTKSSPGLSPATSSPTPTKELRSWDYSSPETLMHDRNGRRMSPEHRRAHIGISPSITWIQLISEKESARQEPFFCCYHSIWSSFEISSQICSGVLERAHNTYNGYVVVRDTPGLQDLQASVRWWSKIRVPDPKDPMEYYKHWETSLWLGAVHRYVHLKKSREFAAAALSLRNYRCRLFLPPDIAQTFRTILESYASTLPNEGLEASILS